MAMGWMVGKADRNLETYRGTPPLVYDIIGGLIRALKAIFSLNQIKFHY